MRLLVGETAALKDALGLVETTGFAGTMGSAGGATTLGVVVANTGEPVAGLIGPVGPTGPLAAIGADGGLVVATGFENDTEGMGGEATTGF